MECSILVIVNNSEIYFDFLENLSTQRDVKFQIITIDNCNNQYSGARQAYNCNIQLAKFSTLIFMHPDIRFNDDDALHDILTYAEEFERYGVIGVAGCKEGSDWGILSNITHGEKRSKAGRNILVPEEIQSVDECFFIIKKDILNKVPFSTVIGWHLYAVEQCFQTSLESLKNYVVPARLHHMSDGRSLDPQYITALKEIIRRYYNLPMYLNTTVKQWKTKGLIAYIYINYYWLKQKIKRILVR